MTKTIPSESEVVSAVVQNDLDVFKKIDADAEKFHKNKNTMNIATCIINNRLITFRPPFKFELEYKDDGMIIADCNDILKLQTYDKSLKKVRKSIEEGINLIWNDYVNCSILQLSKEDIMFRNELKKRVKE